MLSEAAAHLLPVGEDDVGRLQRVDRQTVTAHQPADAAAERQSSDAGVRDLARGHREPVLLCRRVELGEQRASADAHDRAPGIDVDCVQCSQVDAQGTVAHGAPRDGVPATADRERQPGGAGGANCGGDVIRVGRQRDGGGATIDCAVPARAGLVVVGVGRLDEATDEAVGTQPAGKGGGEWRGRVHGDHDRARRVAQRRASPLSSTPIFDPYLGRRRREVESPAVSGAFLSRPISRILSWAAIHLGPALPPGSSRLPGARRATSSPLSGVAPGGVYRAGASPRRWCALTAPFHPCRRPRTVA